jgi:hypothetical protein
MLFPPFKHAVIRRIRLFPPDPRTSLPARRMTLT